MGTLCASKVMLWWETVPVSEAGMVTGLTRADVAWLEEHALRNLGPIPFLPLITAMAPSESSEACISLFPFVKWR